MFQHIIIGQYVDGNSILHKMDPRAKFIAIFLIAIFIFFANNWVAYGAITGFAIIAVLLSKVSLRFIYKGLRPILFLVMMTFLLHMFLTKDGELLYQLGAFTIYEGGVRQGVFISIRLLVLVLITSLLTLTTTSINLTDGLESLLSPLKRLGVPSHEIALMMSISLRFIPTLLQEAEKILKAQMARGVDFTSGPWKERLMAVIPLLIPLFISSFKRAEDLAFAMEARGYRGGEGRTKLRALTWRVLDTVVVIFVVLCGIGLFMLRT